MNFLNIVQCCEIVVLSQFLDVSIEKKFDKTKCESILNDVNYFFFVELNNFLLKRFKQFSYIVMRWIILFTIYRCNTLYVEKIIRIATIYMNRRVFTSALSSIIVSKKIKNKIKSTESKSGKSHFVGVTVTAICWYFHIALKQSNINKTYNQFFISYDHKR